MFLKVIRIADIGFKDKGSLLTFLMVGIVQIVIFCEVLIALSALYGSMIYIVKCRDR